MLNFLFFLNVGICYRCVVPSSYIHGLVSSVALGVVVTGFVLLFQRVCAHLLLKKIHLARLSPGEYCFASLATELGCLGFQDAGMLFGTWPFLVVTEDSGMRLDRCS